MDQTITALKIKISGKNTRGEAFQETTRLEAFGSFGVLIYTTQPLGLSDLIHICGENNKPVASAEVVWIRGGATPAVEVVLHKQTNIDELIAANETIASNVKPSASELTASKSAPVKPLAANEPKSSSTSKLETSTATTEAEMAELIKEIPDDEAVCPSCNKTNAPKSKSCKFCGSYISRGMNTLRSGKVNKATVDAVRAAAKQNEAESNSTLPTSNSGNVNKPSSPSNKTATLASNKTSTLPSDKAPEASSEKPKPVRKPTVSAAAASVATKAEVASLLFYRKIAIVVIIVFGIVLAGTLIPAGVENLSATRFEMVQQKGCTSVSSLARSGITNTSGELEYWFESKDVKVQFARKEATGSVAAQDIENITKEGKKVHGFWCPKGDSSLVPGTAAVPDILTLPWTLKPADGKAVSGEISLRWQNKSMILKEMIGDKQIDRSGDIRSITFYNGQQKVAIHLDPIRAGNFNAPSAKEILFYMPSNQDSAAAADIELTNSSHLAYMAQPGSASGGGFDFRQIILITSGACIGIALLYVGYNFYRVRSL